MTPGSRRILVFLGIMLLAIGLNVVTLHFGAELVPPKLAAVPANPYRWAPVMRAFQQEDRRSPQPLHEVVFVGSSSIRRWDLREWFPELGEKALNRGVEGFLLSDSVYYAEPLVIRYRPRIVVVYAGDNDIEAGASAAEVTERFAQFERKVHAAAPRTSIVFISIKPSILRARLVPTITQANRAIRAYCATQPGLEFLDIQSRMLDAAGAPRRELFQSDGLHLAPAGYRVWTEALAPVLRQLRGTGALGVGPVGATISTRAAALL